MTTDQWGILLGAASALFAFLAWRASRTTLPYLDVAAFKASSLLRMSGQNADHWEIASARIIWPPSAKIVVSELVQDEYGEPWAPPEYEPKAIGRSTKNVDQALSSSSRLTAWLFIVRLKHSPCQRYMRIVWIKKNA